jgi:hypothetical protein
LTWDASPGTPGRLCVHTLPFTPYHSHPTIHTLPYTRLPSHSHPDVHTSHSHPTIHTCNPIHTLPFTPPIHRYAEEARERLTFGRASPIDEVVHRVELRVAHVGGPPGRLSLLCYVVPPPAARAALAGLPLRVLVDFAKTRVLAASEGEETEGVAFEITAHDLTVTPPGGGRVPLEGEWQVVIGGAETNATTTTIEVVRS